jgi:Protein of unknown function (DUF3179)
MTDLLLPTRLFVRVSPRSIGAALLILFLSISGCGDSGGFNTDPDECIVPADLLADGGVGKDGIPALTNPTFVSAAEATYLNPGSRIIGMQTPNGPIAIPHNILWWHEIVNLDLPGEKTAISYCPLTGTSIAFDRSAVGGAEFGVSGLLFQNNLTMYDRNSNESLWPQMMRRAGCGDRNGDPLPVVATQEMSWSGWQGLHPETTVLSDDTGFSRNYRASGYPYGSYEDPENGRLLFTQTIDGRRPPKERVFGIPDGDAGVALPFGELDENEKTVVALEVGGERLVVFWSREHQAALAFRATAGGEDLTFTVQNGRFVDDQSGSEWQIDGVSVAGPRSGNALSPVADAYVAFWFAWAAFQPETIIWEAG